MPITTRRLRRQRRQRPWGFLTQIMPDAMGDPMRWLARAHRGERRAVRQRSHIGIAIEDDRRRHDQRTRGTLLPEEGATPL
jgi:hypothetical protein